MMMTLAQALQMLPGATPVGDLGTTVLRVHTDTRSLQPGDLFRRKHAIQLHGALPTEQLQHDRTRLARQTPVGAFLRRDGDSRPAARGFGHLAELPELADTGPYGTRFTRGRVQRKSLLDESCAFVERKTLHEHAREPDTRLGTRRRTARRLPESLLGGG